jgi:hypothetical protein
MVARQVYSKAPNESKIGPDNGFLAVYFLSSKCVSPIFEVIGLRLDRLEVVHHINICRGQQSEVNIMDYKPYPNYKFQLDEDAAVELVHKYLRDEGYMKVPGLLEKEFKPRYVKAIMAWVHEAHQKNLTAHDDISTMPKMKRSKLTFLFWATSLIEHVISFRSAAPCERALLQAETT